MISQGSCPGISIDGISVESSMLGSLLLESVSLGSLLLGSPLFGSLLLGSNLLLKNSDLYVLGYVGSLQFASLETSEICEVKFWNTNLGWTMCVYCIRQFI